MIGPSVADAAVTPTANSVGVAVVLHRLDLDGAETGGVGDRRPRHAGEDHRADDVDVAEAALHPADERNREAVDATGHAGDVHQIAGQDEERHRQQRKALDAGDHALRQRDVGRDAGDEDVEQRRASPSTARPAGRASSVARKTPISSSMASRLRAVEGAGALEDRNSRGASSRSRPGPSAANISTKPANTSVVDDALRELDRRHRAHRRRSPMNRQTSLMA